MNYNQALYGLDEVLPLIEIQIIIYSFFVVFCIAGWLWINQIIAFLAATKLNKAIIWQIINIIIATTLTQAHSLYIQRFCM